VGIETMGCCGKARANLAVIRAGMTAAKTQSANSIVTGNVLAEGAASSGVRLRYIGPAEIVVRGAATASAYSFSQQTPVQFVDRRDALVLLRTNYFRQV